MFASKWISTKQIILAVVISTSLCISASNTLGETPASSFGFEAVEIYKLTDRAENMHVADFNNDDLNDILVVQNDLSRVDLFLQRKNQTTEPKGWIDTEIRSSKQTKVNEITDSWRYRKVKIALEREVVALSVGDFNNDGMQDFCYTTTPNRIVFRYQSKDFKWQEKQTLQVTGRFESDQGILTGDLNREKKQELVVVGSKSIFVIGNVDGELQTTQKIYKTNPSINKIWLNDLNGDGKLDLVYANIYEADDYPIYVRLATASGAFGPEIRFRLSSLKFAELANTGDKSSALFSLDQRTSRLVYSEFALKSNANQSSSAKPFLSNFAFGFSSKKQTPVIIGDIDADKKSDILVLDPEKAQILSFRQKSKNGISQFESSPTFLGVEQAVLGDLDADGKNEIAVLSQEEKRVGICRFESGLITFPTIVPLENSDPYLVALDDTNGNGKDEIILITRKGSSYQLEIHAMKGNEFIRVAEPISYKMSSSPKGLVSLDANADGITDLLITYTAGREPILLLGRGDSKFELIPTDSGGIRLTGVDAERIYVSPKNPSLIILSQDSFARQVKLDEKDRWQVVEQFNPQETNAKITAATSLEFDETPGEEIVLLDSSNNRLQVYRKAGSRYESWKSINLVQKGLSNPQAADLNSDGQEDVLLQSKESGAILYNKIAEPRLIEKSSSLSQIKDSSFSQFALGDLNSDGSLDAAVVDTESHNIEVFSFTKQKKLLSMVHWKVFDEKSFGENRKSTGEPREIRIADVTGDGRDDLILLVHDRMLVYPQQMP